MSQCPFTDPAAPREQARFWRVQGCADLELLRATYVTHIFPRHAHESYTIGVIAAGAEAFLCRGRMHLAPMGSLVAINPGEVHTGQAVDGQGWTQHIFYLNAALLEGVDPALTVDSPDLPYFPNPVIEDASLAKLILNVHLALEHSAFTLAQESRLTWALAQLIARHAGNRPSLPSLGRAHQSVKRVQDYLEAHFAENVSLQQLAQIANLSPFHLLRLFRKQVGLPPHAYLMQVRVARAKTRLAAGYTIATVTQETGFVDQSHLTRHFKRIVGVTPGQYVSGARASQGGWSQSS